jgi:hypothetical protein
MSSRPFPRIVRELITRSSSTIERLTPIPNSARDTELIRLKAFKRVRRGGGYLGCYEYEAATLNLLKSIGEGSS